MAMINLKNNKTNTVTIGSGNTYCKMCIDKAMIEAEKAVPYGNIKNNFAAKLTGQKVFKMRLSGTDHYFCKECWNKINMELNPEVYKVEEDK